MCILFFLWDEPAVRILIVSVKFGFSFPGHSLSFRFGIDLARYLFVNKVKSFEFEDGFFNIKLFFMIYNIKKV